MSCPVLPAHVELPISPNHDGKFVEISFSKLGSSLEWLNDSVDLLAKGLKQVHSHLAAQEDLWKRLENLENKPPPEPTIVKEAAPQVNIEIPYIPSNEDIAGIALKTATPVVEEKAEALQNEMVEKLSPLEKRIKVLEDIEANRKDPFARMQKYFQEIGFLPYGEPDESDPLKLLGQLFVLLRQDIAKCPKIQDLEAAEAALNARISEVEATAKADGEEIARVAAAESAKIREDLEKVKKQVDALIQKNLEDGDVAGGLRDLTIRVDKIEDLLRKKDDAKVVEEKIVEKPPREKGFLEKLAEVDLNEEVRRLRSMVECMEAAMPYETRQTMEYLKNGQSPQAPEASPVGGTTTSSGTMMPSQMEQSPFGMSANLSGTFSGSFPGGGGADIRQETEDQLHRLKQQQSRELQHVMKVMKNQERTIEALEAKILDLWKRLPKVLALLEPLQAQMETTMGNEDILQDSTGGGPNKSVTFATEGDTGGDVNVSNTNVFIGTSGVNGVNGKNAETLVNQTGVNGVNGKNAETLVNQTGPNPTLPAVQPPPGWGQGLAKGRKDFLTGFIPVGEGTGGTGGGTSEPLREMGSLTGLIKLALQRTTDDIHADLRQELLRLRQEFLGRLDLKADKTELLALLSRLDEMSKKGKRVKDIHAFNKARDRSLSPPLDQAADTRSDRNDGSAEINLRQAYNGADVRQASPPTPGKPMTTSASSPNLSERKKGHSCHENCKVPTCPKAMQMQQSLSRLPALKVVQ